jgi:ubiquinone/menaquinone biosynthesis C-methylase UbiE
LKNFHKKTIDSFGDQWSEFDQSYMPSREARKIFNKYFSIFPWKKLPKNAEGFDMGCGTGRWAKFVAPKVSILHCIDPSKSLNVAKVKLKNFKNINFHKASLDNVNLLENSQDFGYSLGVLHHVPDTQAAIKSCARLLKSESPLLLYLYYSFDNRSWLYILIWKFSNTLRKFISIFPSKIKTLITDFIAIIIYYPLARTSKILDKLNVNVGDVPLSFYKDKSFYTMRTDSRDRFGTILENRFSKSEIKKMMENAGLNKIKFSKNNPFWRVVGYKKK